jgi:hypothetical protein
MHALRIALSFVLVPRLFVSLILFPLLLSIVFVIGQMFVTRLFLKSIEQSESAAATPATQVRRESLIRLILFGSAAPLPSPTVCRWKTHKLPQGGTVELPPNKACSPDRLDVALHIPNPENYQIGGYMQLLDGSFERIHLCKQDCKPDVVIFPEQTPRRAEIQSVWGLALLQEARLGVATRQDFVEKVQEIKATQGLIGDQYLFTEGIRGAISLREIMYSLAVVMNLAMLIIIALWLALKAHRKVLDYFAHSGALLPMVAATGKGAFYSALWLLTIFRVAAFLIAAVPVMLIGIIKGIPESSGPLFGGTDIPELTLWVVTISISMAFATLIASIADLKHRHAVFSFIYKFLPLILSGCGAVIWGATFIITGEGSTMVRDTISALPLFGMAPMLLAPIVKPKLGIFVLHALLTMLLLLIAAKINARWFAAHLEEL